MTNSTKAQTITLPTSQGNAEAERTGGGYWNLNTPWTSARFHGTAAEAKRELTRLIAEGEACEREDVAALMLRLREAPVRPGDLDLA